MSPSQAAERKHVLRFRPGLAFLERAADDLRGLLRARELADDVRYNVELAFEEIVTNIVRHASPTGDIRATIAFNDEIVLIRGQRCPVRSA